MRVKIEGTNYTRDLQTMAVLCHEQSEVLKYENQIKQHHDNMARDKEINKLKSEISEIKEMLQILIRGQNG